MNMRSYLFPFFMAFLMGALISVAPAYAQDRGSKILEFFTGKKPEAAPSQEGAPSSPAGRLPAPSQPKARLKIPDEYIEAALAYEARCEANGQLSNYYNCQCLSVNYLDRLVEQEGRVNEDSFMLSMERQCQDGTKIAGGLYNECMGGAIMPPFDRNITPEAFCECIANTYARIYESSRARPTSNLHVALKSRAIISCRDPALGRELYPTGPVFN